MPPPIKRTIPTEIGIWLYVGPNVRPKVGVYEFFRVFDAAPRDFDRLGVFVEGNQKDDLLTALSKPEQLWRESRYTEVDGHPAPPN